MASIVEIASRLILSAGQRYLAWSDACALEDDGVEAGRDLAARDRWARAWPHGRGRRSSNRFAVEACRWTRDRLEARVKMKLR